MSRGGASPPLLRLPSYSRYEQGYDGLGFDVGLGGPLVAPLSPFAAGDGGMQAALPHEADGGGGGGPLDYEEERAAAAPAASMHEDAAEVTMEAEFVAFGPRVPFSPSPLTADS